MKNKVKVLLLSILCVLTFVIGFFFVGDDNKLGKVSNNDSNINYESNNLLGYTYYIYKKTSEGCTTCIEGQTCQYSTYLSYQGQAIAPCSTDSHVDPRWGSYADNLCYVSLGSTRSNLYCIYTATKQLYNVNEQPTQAPATQTTKITTKSTTRSTTKSTTRSTTRTTMTTTQQVVTIPVPSVKEEELNAYFYAKEGARYSGASIYCGDRVYVTKCDENGYCTVTKINGGDVKTSTKVYKNKLSTTDISNTCSSKVGYVKEGTNTYTNSSMSVKKQSLTCGTEISLTPSLGDRCTDGVCKVTIKGEEQYIYLNNILRDKPACSASTTDEKCESSSKLTDFKDKVDNFKICYKKNQNGEYVNSENDNISEKVTCAENYDKSIIEKQNTCKTATGDTCYISYTVSCDYMARPSVSSTGSIVRADGYGTVTLQATDNGSQGIKGYYISSGTEPIINSEWTSFNDESYVARENKMAGTYFVWVINKNNRISYPSMSRIYDADTSTTISSFSVKSTDGTESYDAKPLDDETTAYESATLVDSKYVRLSNTLKNDSVLASFDLLKTGYELTVNRSKVAIYASLTSSDASFVEGFEPRTVDVKYGRNVELIKIVNKKGKIRTYTFIINRVDDRDNNNFLSDIKLSAGTIDFNPYVTDYTVKVSKKVTKVSINGTLESKTAAFVAGYEPRTIELTSEQTSAVLKTVSNAGIVRSYVITFVKDSNLNVDDIKTSTYLSSLSIPGTSLVYDRDTTSYTVSVGYEVENLPIYAFAESENAVVKIIGDSGFRVGNNQIEITVTNGKKTKIYNVYVIRKESGLTVASDTSLNTLTIKDYNLDFKPDVYDYNIKIKREKTLLITATPNDDRAEVYMYGNNDLTAFSIVKVKVIAENGDTKVYSINIEKDKYNKKLETTSAIIGGVILLGASIIIIVKRKRKAKKDYLEG